MAEKWQYRIEPYRRIPGEAGFSPAPESQAEMWFGFRERGDDHRCFGVFPTRGDAERAMGMLKEQERISEAEEFNRMLDEKAGRDPAQPRQKERSVEREAMDEKRRLEGFQALVASDKSGSHFLEDKDGEHRRWPELSSEGKLEFIAGAAAMYDVPFERFAATVHAELGDAASVTQAALHVALNYRKELHGLARLVPDDGRTEPTPLVERFQEILEYKPPERAGLLAYDATESVKTQLESFMDEFERLAKSPEQKKLVEGFKGFVGEVTSANWKETFDKLLARHAEGERQTPEKGKGIER